MKESGREQTDCQNSVRQEVKAGSEVYRKERSFKDHNIEMLIMLSGRPRGCS